MTLRLGEEPNTQVSAGEPSLSDKNRLPITGTFGTRLGSEPGYLRVSLGGRPAARRHSHPNAESKTQRVSRASCASSPLSVDLGLWVKSTLTCKSESFFRSMHLSMHFLALDCIEPLHFFSNIISIKCHLVIFLEQFFIISRGFYICMCVYIRTQKQ